MFPTCWQLPPGAPDFFSASQACSALSALENSEEFMTPGPIPNWWGLEVSKCLNSLSSSRTSDTCPTKYLRESQWPRVQCAHQHTLPFFSPFHLTVSSSSAVLPGITSQVNYSWLSLPWKGSPRQRKSQYFTMSYWFTMVYHAVGSTESPNEPGEENSYKQDPMAYEASTFILISVPLHHLI